MVALYLPPSITHSDSDLVTLGSITGEGEVIVGGDLNAKHPDWGGTIGNESGRCLREFLLDNLDLKIMKTDGPTSLCHISILY